MQQTMETTFSVPNIVLGSLGKRQTRFLSPRACILGQRLSKLKSELESLGSFVKTQIAGPHPRVSVSICLGWGPRFCISNKFSGDTNAAGLGTL